jgi:hypothetical protein
MTCRVRLAILCAALGAALPFPSWATPSADSFDAARTEFERGRHGDGGANDRAFEQFKKLSEQEPRNALYLAYFGSSSTIRGRDAWAPWNKWKYTEQGLDLLDKAVEMARRGPAAGSDRIETLLVASSTFLGVPKMFNRFEAGKAAVSEAMTSPSFADAPVPMRAELWHLASLVARKEGKREEEARSLEEALKLWSDGPFAVEARERLKELRG